MAVTLVLGGTRSGKSAAAERIALGMPGTGDLHRHRGRPRTISGSPTTTWLGGSPTTSVPATCASSPSRPDDELVGASRRLRRTRPRRLARHVGRATWSAESKAFTADVDALVSRAGGTHRRDRRRLRRGRAVSVHPESAAGRRFRDTLGTVNRAVADVADEVWLVVAGRGLRLDRLPVRPTTTLPTMNAEPWNAITQ